MKIQTAHYRQVNKLQNWLKLKILCMKRLEQKSLKQESTIKKIENYIFKSDNLLGKGNFGQAYRGIDINTKTQVAIKVIKINSIKSITSKKMLQNQIEILKNIKQHPNLLKCCDAFTSLNNCYIITELCESDLQKQLTRKGKFTQSQIKQIVVGIYKGLEQLYKNCIVHRDIKIANIFLSTNGTPKIADFGFAVRAHTSFKDLSIGSPLYMSPQGLLYQQYGPKTDVWSFGILIYELLFGQAPLYKCKDDKQLRTQILQPSTYPFQISYELKEVINSCLTVNPTKRPNILQVGNLSYFHSQSHKLQCMPKLVKSSSKLSTEGSINSSNELENLYFFRQQLTYENGISLLHYCRLLHKINTKLIKSNFLSQFLLNLSSSLCEANFLQNYSLNEQLTKLKRVFIDYRKKFRSEHEDMKIFFNPRQTLVQISKLLKNSKSKLCFQALQILDAQTKVLIYSLEHQNLDIFTKNTQAKVIIEQGKLKI